MVDGEIVALDESGRPNFNLLQSFRSEASRIHYFIFDMLICKNRDLTRLPLCERRNQMKSALKIRSPRIRIAEQFDVSATDMLAAVRQQQLEGVIGKRKDSLYQPGKRTGAWIKYRVNRGQEFVIGGYIPGPHGFDSLIVGYYRGKDLVYVARVRNGFVPASRWQVFEKIRGLASPEMPFVKTIRFKPGGVLMRSIVFLGMTLLAASLGMPFHPSRKALEATLTQGWVQSFRTRSGTFFSEEDTIPLD